MSNQSTRVNETRHYSDEVWEAIEERLSRSKADPSPDMHIISTKPHYDGWMREYLKEANDE